MQTNLDGLLAAAERSVEQCQAQKAEIDDLLTQAREASGNIGAKLYAETFDALATKNRKSADKWLKGVCLMALAWFLGAAGIYFLTNDESGVNVITLRVAILVAGLGLIAWGLATNAGCCTSYCSCSLRPL